MSRRHIFTERQRAALFDLPTDELSLLKFYTLGDDDLENIRQRRRPENRIGFALQLCALRYPGRALAPGEMIPREVLSFVGAQLGVPADALLTYATRRQTRQQHMDTLREIYGYKTFTGRGARDLREWTFGQAEDARSNEDLAHRFIVRCRETSTILPAVSTIERLCADALVAAERRIETRIAENLTADVRDHLDKLLSEMLAGNISRFIWLRNFEVGNNSAAANRLLDRLEFLRTLNINHSALASIPAHRIARLRRQGERYFTDGLRDITSDRRWAILAVCVVGPLSGRFPRAPRWPTAPHGCIHSVFPAGYPASVHHLFKLCAEPNTQHTDLRRPFCAGHLYLPVTIRRRPQKGLPAPVLSQKRLQRHHPVSS